jgi:transcriptional regulator with PAS, ATPase and Fis domain
MAAVSGSDRKATTLVLTGSDGGDLVARRWRIEIVEGPDEGRSIVKDAGTVTVGNDASVDLRLSDDTVSRFHAELRLMAEGVLVVDLGSTNGTRIGKTLIESALVQPGGTVRFGRTKARIVAEDEPVEIEKTEKFGAFLTLNATLEKTLAQLSRAAESDATILIEGETGTGKELLARAVHDHSPRNAGPFIVVDCGAVTDSLLESELFGHVKGSFTGAVADREGALEAAHRGTVFLDEFGELPVALQPKLLRVLEARTIRRIGETKERAIDVRFVAATNRNLEKEMKAGAFRPDLFYRVAVVRARVPPLRERREDLPLLAHHFASSLSDGRVCLAEETIRALQNYDWPGNVRELRNVIERAIALSRREVITPPDLFDSDRVEEPRPPMAQEPYHDAKERLIADFERRYVSALLARHHGKVALAAQEAGLSRPALYALMRRTGIE